MDLPTIFVTLQNYGIIDFIIPFMLVFSLVYAILLKVKLFGDPANPAERHSKRIYMIISLAFGIFSIIPHYVPIAGVPDLVNIMKGSFPQVSILLLVVLSIFIVLGLFGAELNLMGDKNSLGAGILIFLSAIVIVIYMKAANILNESIPIIGPLLFGQGNQDLWNLVVAIAVFGIVIWFITKDEKDPHKVTTFDKMQELFRPIRK